MNSASISSDISKKGYSLVPDFLAGPGLQEAERAISEYFPNLDDSNTDDDRQMLRHAVPFPFSSNILNKICLDNRVIDVASSLLGTEDLRLTSSFVQAKYGTAYGESKDQSLHNDAWSVNSLVPPRTDGFYQRLFGILYLTDVTVDTAPTYVVDRASNVGVPLMTSSGKAAYDKHDYPYLYDLEKPVEASAGSLLLFAGDIVHRGSAYRGRFGRRLAVFFNIHAAAVKWTDKHVWASRPAAPNWGTVRNLMEELEPRQRQLLGFPSPADDYWTEESISEMMKLYPGMDVSVYKARCTQPHSLTA